MQQLLDSNGMTEEQSIALYKSKNYPKPAVTADIAVFWRNENNVKILLIKRGGHPYIGRWALPGGFTNENEPVEETAARELEEESGVCGLPLKLVGVFSKPNRDPRDWIITVAFTAVTETAPPIQAGDDAAEAKWFLVEKKNDELWLKSDDVSIKSDELAFDHNDMLKQALNVTGLHNIL